MIVVDAQADPEGAVRAACQVLRSGEPVAIPTETVYGLAGDIHNERSIQRIFGIKARPNDNPLICHVASIEMAQNYVIFDDMALTLARSFWPGPLTLVLKRKLAGRAIEMAAASLPTLAVRVPQGFSRDLIESFGSGLAAPSANLSGRLSPTSANHVTTNLGNRMAMVLDGGPCTIGLESTVVEVSDGKCRLLRPGGLDVTAIQSVIGTSLVNVAAGQGFKSPGMMASHYAPSAKVRLDARQVFPGEALILFGPHSVAGAANAVAAFNLSEKGNLKEAASRLFDTMVQADASGAGTIAVTTVPCVGLGLAINDRLRRSAAPRPL
ncbi:L-threonylcarbamoyladenylate synthase [Phyllobacterium endophyticum]|nr:L-threonylcarbamoyladenylate synthase [Phyllobacterium endophyticum]